MNQLHGDAPTATAGSAPEVADVGIVAVHGRGATARGILDLATALDLPSASWRAPQATAGTWYPQSFLAPLEANEPWLSAALDRLDAEVEALLAAGLDRSRIALLGFSQGACLALEFAVRRARPWHAVVALTGGLLGPSIERHAAAGNLAETPVFLASGDPDPHVPASRVLDTAAMLRQLGARVEVRLDPGRPHVVTAREIGRAREIFLGDPPRAESTAWG
ncbi:MAG: dienelactone hydrolase family protein [Acidobacteriota bacterium]